MRNIIVLSIHQKHWDNIKSGNKTIEIRKTVPKKVEYPFRVLCYVTGGVGIVGAFTCDGVDKTNLYETFIEESCLTEEELIKYAKGGSLYGWHIKANSVKSYKKPYPLEEYGVDRAPQSWQYYM